VLMAIFDELFTVSQLTFQITPNRQSSPLRTRVVPRSAFFMPVAMTRLTSSIDVLQSRTTLMARVFNAPVSLLNCLRAGLNQGFCGMSTVLSGVLWYVLVLFNLPLLITSTTAICEWSPASGHSQTYCARLTPSIYQGPIQGSLCRLGWEVSGCHAWTR